jgi:hypothetical protein
MPVARVQAAKAKDVELERNEIKGRVEADNELASIAKNQTRRRMKGKMSALLGGLRGASLELETHFGKEWQVMNLTI